MAPACRDLPNRGPGIAPFDRTSNGSDADDKVRMFIVVPPLRSQFRLTNGGYAIARGLTSLQLPLPRCAEPRPDAHFRRRVAQIGTKMVSPARISFCQVRGRNQWGTLTNNVFAWFKSGNVTKGRTKNQTLGHVSLPLLEK